ncbi:MAG: histidine kinase [Paenibacillaceae bacterium]|nr:histidine kinase [Paenibacillaceae bacterium]
MKALWGKWRVSIFSKLVLTFLVVMTPMYALGTVMNEWGADLVKSEISKSLRSQIAFYRTSLETEIDRMVRLQREYVNDEDLVSLSITPESMTEYQKQTTIKRFQQRLETMKESSYYIAKASVYIPPIDRVISTERLSEPIDRPLLETMKREGAQSRSIFYSEGDGRIYLREYYPGAAMANQRDPMFILELELSVPTLQKFLKQLSDSDRGGAAIIQRDWTIVEAKRQEHLAAISERVQSYYNQERTATYLSTQDTEPHTETIRFDRERILTVSTYSSKLDASLLVYLPESDVMGPLEKYRLYIWLVSAVALMVLLAFAYWIFRIIHRPLTRLVRAFRKVEAGNLQLALQYRSNDEFFDLYQQFNNMVAHLNTLIFEVYEQKIRLQQSELKQLQSQINPHFLYNSFYLLYRMTRARDFDNSTRFAKYLGDYFQYITRGDKEEVELEKELGHVRAYSEIQSIRFGDRIKVEFGDVPEECGRVMVPRLILQPIVENAYQHGLGDALGESRLTIRVERTTAEGEPALRIVVEDNGKGLSEAQCARWEALLNGWERPEDVTGMLNVHKRLQLKFGARAGISLSPGAGGAGLRVTITLPFEEAAP